MKRNTTILAPGLVLLAAVLTGGWFLQKGVSQEKNVYFQVRLFDEVIGYVSSSFVDPVEAGDLYQSAIQGVLEDLGDPNTSFMPAAGCRGLPDPDGGGVRRGRARSHVPGRMGDGRDTPSG